MALNTVLSALRSLILDGVEIPRDPHARRALYQKRFQPLTETELEDLVIIPPEKLQIYTNTVFSGHRSTLLMHFPVTYALLATRCGKTFDGFRLVQELHAEQPWQGNATLTLARSFVDFLSSLNSRYRKAAPEAPDVAQMECLALEIARGFNPSDTGMALLTPEEKGALLVEELLGLPVLLPENLRYFHSCFDVLSFRSAYFERNGSIPDRPATVKNCFYIGGRDPSHFVRWTEVSPPVYKLLTGHRPGDTILVDDIASAFLEGQASESTEDELFQQFMAMFMQLERYGICFLPAKAPHLRAAAG